MAQNVCKELANVPVSRLPTALHSFLSDAVCSVFSNQGDLNSSPKDQVVIKELTDPLQWMLFSGDPIDIFSKFENQGTTSNFCGKVFKNGEPAYFCKDCQTDPTCCLCMDCFDHSEHKNHKHRLFASGGGGCCDCGDPEAWTSGVYCELHEPMAQNDEEIDPVAGLPSEFAHRVHLFFKTLLWYCMDILASSDRFSLPASLHRGKSGESLQEEKFLAFLYNDEVHSYDEVIYTLTHKVSLTHTEAVALATYVDRKGRAIVKKGSKHECQRVLEHINANTDQPLTVKLFHATVTAHQENAIICLSLLKDLAEKTPAFRRLISQALVDTSYQEGKSILDNFFLYDSSLWITARVSWHRLVMSSIFMDSGLKKQMAITLSSNYCQLQKNFVSDSHHHDVCATNMTVQIFTTPSLSRMLVLEHGLLSVILQTLQDLLAPCKDPSTGYLKLQKSNYKHSRIFYIVYDLRYVLRTKPEQWTQQLRIQVLQAFDCLLELLSWLQGADPVRRQRQHHVEREEPWEHCFNFSILMQPAVLLFLEWCISDASVLQGALHATYKKHEQVGELPKMDYKHHTSEESIVGTKSIELIMFDILKESVSIHQPLPRIIATLFSGAHQHGLTFQQLLGPQLLGISPHDNRVPLFLMEYCSRSIVMAVQVMAGMWKRNGYSVVNQIINYQYHLSREIMYDKDILMLQAMASILNPDVFMYALIYKFRLEKWLSSPDSDPSKRGEPSEDALRFFISEAEEFLFLLIVIFTERFSKGVGEGMTKSSMMRREIIHQLYISPLSHSEIIKHLKLNESENDVDSILNEVATLRRRHGSSGKYVYELKSEFEEQCCPFFYHYTRPDHSKAEEIHRKKVKAIVSQGTVITPSPPPNPPPFTTPFDGVMRLAQCPVLHRMLHCVLKQAASPDSKFWSDRLLHETLYLCGVILADEDADKTNSLCNAAIGVIGNHPFIQFLETLLTNQRAEEHQSLLQWCVDHLRAAKVHKCGSTDVDMDGSQSPSQDEVDTAVEMEDDNSTTNEDPSTEMTEAEREAQEKREMFLTRRSNLMTQMAVMQRRFFKEHQEELDKIDASQECGAYTGRVYLHECAVGADSLLFHAPFPIPTTCILCQEETNDYASQPKPYVQAVYVHRTSVLSRGENKLIKNDKNLYDYSKVDFLTSRSDFTHGAVTSGCAHHMHAECWKLFLDNKRVEHGRQHFFPLPGQSVDWDSGEYLCPLCECYGSTVLPLIPQVGQLALGTEPTLPVRTITMQEWRGLLTLAVELGSGDDMDTGVSVDPTFLDRLENIFPTYKKPTELLVFSEEKENLTGDMHEIFSQSVFMNSYGAFPDLLDKRVCLAEWNSCAYFISSLEHNARYQEKFLLSADTLSSRQMNTVRSLVRLGSEPRIRPEVSVQAKYLQFLMNCFLLEGPAFPELPSILDLDCFLMFVNLHFSISALFISLSSPYGIHAPLKGDPIILQLIGITDTHIVRLTAAAHMLQFLLTFSPASETRTSDEAFSQELELTDGEGLRDVWIKYRKIANLSHDNPPNLIDLSVHLHQHMYPFLQCTALFLNGLTGINFVHSSATMATSFKDLCKYIGLPSNLCSLFSVYPDESTSGMGESTSGPDESTSGPGESTLDDETITSIISAIAKNWCANPKVTEVLGSCTSTLPALQNTKRLVELPESYSVLVKSAAEFQCSRRLVDVTYGDDGQATMLCLVCGAMLCTNSYCCQVEVEKADRKTRIGGFTQHVQKCGAGIGMALWILESYVVLLDATDVYNVKGCTVTPPYLDEYREPDPGLRRGNPLQLNQDIYEELKLVWFQYHIPGRIHAEMEKNPGLMRIKWDHM